MQYYKDKPGDYIFRITVEVKTDCGGCEDNSNVTNIEISGFTQRVESANIEDSNGTYGVKIEIVGDLEAHDFLMALIETIFKFRTAYDKNKYAHDKKLLKDVVSRIFE
jgi:hypothetical protein